MDAIEAARQQAAKLHQAACARGSDTSALLSFVTDEAERRGIDVYPLSQGDPQLNGGRALYDS